MSFVSALSNIGPLTALPKQRGSFALAVSYMWQIIKWLVRITIGLMLFFYFAAFLSYSSI